MTEPLRVTLWIETASDDYELDSPGALEARGIALRTMADLGAKLLAMAAADHGFDGTVSVRPTLDMPGTWLVDVEFPL